MEEKKRLKKFRREKSAFPALQIQERDVQILNSLADYRFLTTSHILALHSGGERNLQRRLQKLFHAGFIDRPPRQISYHRPQGDMVYALGNRGVDLLAERLNMERGKVNWTTKNREAKDRYIQHALMISNFRTVLTLALNNPLEGVIKDWRQSRELKDYVRIDQQKVAIVPDAFFTVEDAKSRMHFFLEADQSTMTRGRFLKKMKAYWNWWKEGGHQKKLGIKSFRVLVLCKSEKRKESLRRITKEADDKKQGSLMFWFVSEDKFALAEPESVLRSIWQTPKDDAWHSLLE